MNYKRAITIRDGSRCGFTLLEILLVTVILSAIIGISIPNFSPTFKRMELKKTSNDLAYFMRYAQSRAVTYNTIVRLEFTSDYSSYWLKQKIKKGAAEENETSGVSDAPGSFEGQEAFSGGSSGGNDLENTPSDDSQGDFRRVKGRYGKTYRVSSVITIETEKLTMDFYPDGSIDKRQLSLCDKKYCYSISTKERRGYVYVYGYEKNG